MDEVNKTLYIPLYGKSYVSKKGILLRDPGAEKIWCSVEFPLGRKSRSRWLAYYMGMRAAVFDRWTEAALADLPDGVVLHIGCGLDSRCQRVNHGDTLWHDVDFPDVIREREKYFAQSECYRMIPGDLREDDWLGEISGNSAIVVMEGISMYLAPEELKAAMERLCRRFEKLTVVMDCYSTFAARASKYKNPINEVGVSQVYGMDAPTALEGGGLKFQEELDMTPEDMICQLSGWEQTLFRRLYAGKMARNLYRMYVYRKEN